MNAPTVSEQAGVRFLEGPPGEFMRQADDSSLVIESWAAAETRSVLLHASNMPPRFFDLSSGEAGQILQRFRVYGVRIALVCPPETVQLSSRFPELMAEENRLPYLRFFESVETAHEWLIRA